MITDANGQVTGSTNLQAADIHTLNRLPSTNLFSLADVVQLPVMQFSASAQKILQHSGRLAAGAYTFTVQLYNSRDSLLAERIAVLNVTAFQLPVLMAPADNAGLDAHVASGVITFRWTRLIPVLQELPRYRVQVFEILNTQTPMQAFRSNTPLLDVEAPKGATQLIWRSNLPMTDSNSNRQFIWTVQTLDFNGNPIPASDANSAGRSEPAVFRIINQPGTKAAAVQQPAEKKDR